MVYIPHTCVVFIGARFGISFPRGCLNQANDLVNIRIYETHVSQDEQCVALFQIYETFIS